MTLTEKKIRDAKPGSATHIEWDDVVKGLGLRITAAGVKSYVFNYRVDGRMRRMTLGRTSELALSVARERAGEARQAVRGGRDPLGERQNQKTLPTVSEGLDRFLTEYMPQRVEKGRMAERTAREYTRQIKRDIRPVLGRKRIADVTKSDVERVLKPLPPIMANRVQALLSRLFNLFEDWELRPQHTNPARGVEKAVEDARDRTLSESELSALGKALDTMKDANPGALLTIRLAALTGLRIGEIQNMRWADINLDAGSVVLPKTKTGRRIHTLPSAAIALLVEAKRVGECVIPGRDPNRSLDYRSIQRHWVKACKAAGIKGARLHDLRRTIMTEAAALGVGAHLLRDMVGHKTTAMADRYVRRAGAPLIELRERMGEAMAAKLAGDKVSKE